MNRLYFDYNATTPLAPIVKECLAQLVNEDLKNPSSIHWEGQVARNKIQEARSQIASLLSCDTNELCFTSGATEAHNILFNALWENRPSHRNKIITSSAEHDSVIKPLRGLQEKGAVLEVIPVNRFGEIDWKKYYDAIDEETLFVSIMAANNETGILFPVQELSNSAHQFGALFHTDAGCALGKIPFDFKKCGVDFASFSGHKFYAPKGIGGLVMRQGTDLPSLVLGGPQERGVRAGTENISGCLAMAVALNYACENLKEETNRLQKLRHQIIDGLSGLDSSIIVHENSEASAESQLSGTLNIAFPYLDGQTLLAHLDLEGVAASHGSACHSGSQEISRVLLSMDIPEPEAKSSIRLSFGKMTTEEEVGQLLGVFEKVLGKMRKQVA